MSKSTRDNALVQLNSALDAVNWLSDRAAVLEKAQSVVKVTNADELEEATSLEKEAKRLVKILSSKRLELTRPLDALKKGFTQAEEREAKELNALIARLDRLNAGYALEQARKAEEERRRIEDAERAAAEAELARIEAANAANAAFGFAPPPEPTEPAPTPVFAPTVQKAAASNASFIEVWKFDVIDPNAVPRELCSPDPAKIKAFLAAKKAEGYKIDQFSVNGLRFFMDVQVRAR